MSDKYNCTFQVGDRVAVYGGISMIDNLGVTSGRKLATVMGILGEGAGLDVLFDKDVHALGGRVWSVNPKQCRKLKKRERRRVWIKAQTQPCEHGAHFSVRDGMISPPPEGPGWIEFVEVRKSK